MGGHEAPDEPDHSEPQAANISDQSALRQSGISARYQSNLQSPLACLMSELLADWMQRQLLSAEHFIQHFTPGGLLKELSASPELRVRVLVESCGTHERIAARKSFASAAEDFELALEEGTTSPAFVFGLLSSDEWVSVLGADATWGFLTADEFWLSSDADEDETKARARLLQVIEQAYALELLRPTDLIRALTDDELLQRLSTEQLRQALSAALEAGTRGEALTRETLAPLVETTELLGSLSLERLWTRVVQPKLSFGSPAARPRSRPPAPRTSAATDADSGTTPISEERISQPPAKPRTLARSSSQQERPSVPPPPPSLQRLDGETAEVCRRLDELDRLPPNFTQLSLSVLRAIESMYMALAHATEPEQQLNIIRGSFPSDEARATGALALLELLNPKLSITSPEVANEDADTLSVRLLREERRRAGAEPEREAFDQQPQAGAEFGSETSYWAQSNVVKNADDTDRKLARNVDVSPSTRDEFGAGRPRDGSEPDEIDVIELEVDEEPAG